VPGAEIEARLDPDRVKEPQLHDAIFHKERGALFAVWDCRQNLQQDGFRVFHGFTPAGMDFCAAASSRLGMARAFATLAPPQSDPGLIRSG
jgi:hypothetical protein